MNLIELKKIAKQSSYRLKRDEYELTLLRDVGKDGVIVNKILIYLDKEKSLFINNMFCDDKDIQMIKAAVEFAETPVEDRGEVRIIEITIDTKDKLLNEINRILDYVKDFELVEVEEWRSLN